MAEDVGKLRDDFEDLKKSLQEYGIVANTAKKTGGALEKGLGKMRATIAKSPFVQLTKSLQGFAKQTKLAIQLSTNQNDMTEEEIEQAKSKQTMLSKLVTTMFSYTAVAKMLHKNC